MNNDNFISQVKLGDKFFVNLPNLTVDQAAHLARVLNNWAATGHKWDTEIDLYTTLMDPSGVHPACVLKVHYTIELQNLIARTWAALQAAPDHIREMVMTLLPGTGSPWVTIYEDYGDDDTRWNLTDGWLVPTEYNPPKNTVEFVTKVRVGRYTTTFVVDDGPWAELEQRWFAL